MSKLDIFKQLALQDINPGAFAGNSWHNESSSTRLLSYSPASGEKLGEIAACTLQDYEKVMIVAKTAASSWREVPAPKRGEIIRQVAQVLRENKVALGRLVSMEMGKSLQEGEGEVQEMIDIADFAVGQSRMLYGNTMHSERPWHRMYEQWHPYGIVGVISAFNFPVAVWAWNAFIAAICGNVTIWKPSAKTPLCAVAVQNLCNQVLRDNNCVEIFSLVIPDSHEVAEVMVNDSRISLVSFTGSTAVGKKVAAKVSARLGKTILELGGNNAIIVDATADLHLAIPAIVFGAVGTAGQRCTSTRRLFVHQSLYQEVLQRLEHAYSQVTVGDPLDLKNLMGPLIDGDAVAAFTAAIARIKAKGGKIVFGGEVLDRQGCYVQPTLVAEINPDWDIVQEETFAPILYVMPFTRLNEAIALQNGVRQGLSSAIFTQNIKNAEYFLSALGSDCGIANVNIGTSGAEIGGACGGEKETGGGRESGSDSWKAYMRRQTNTINWGDELPLAQGIQFNLSDLDPRSDQDVPRFVRGIQHW